MSNSGLFYINVHSLIRVSSDSTGLHSQYGSQNVVTSRMRPHKLMLRFMNDRYFC